LATCYAKLKNAPPFLFSSYIFQFGVCSNYNVLFVVWIWLFCYAKFRVRMFIISVTIGADNYFNKVSGSHCCVACLYNMEVHTSLFLSLIIDKTGEHI